MRSRRGRREEGRGRKRRGSLSSRRRRIGRGEWEKN